MFQDFLRRLTAEDPDPLDQDDARLALTALLVRVARTDGTYDAEEVGLIDKIAAARRRGKWTGGPVPIGYDVVDRRLVVNELEAVVVRELFDLYEAGRIEPLIWKRYPLEEIASALAALEGRESWGKIVMTTV